MPQRPPEQQPPEQLIGPHPASFTGPQLPNDFLRLVGLRPTGPPLSMGWCIECHREQNRTPDMHAPLDCVTCHH